MLMASWCRMVSFPVESIPIPIVAGRGKLKLGGAPGGWGGATGVAGKAPTGGLGGIVERMLA